MGNDLVLTEKKDSVRIITINKPPANALSGIVIEELDKALSHALSDNTVRCVIFTGQGSKVFASGADIKELEGFDEKKALKTGMELPFSEAMREETRLFVGLCNSLDKIEGVRAFLEKRKPEFVGR